MANDDELYPCGTLVEFLHMLVKGSKEFDDDQIVFLRCNRQNVDLKIDKRWLGTTMRCKLDHLRQMANVEIEEIVSEPPRDYLNRCLTCKNWSGAKKKQARAVNEYGPVCMDLHKGWPRRGECEINYHWSDVEITGDATARLVVNANHGCNRWEKDDA